MNKVATIDQTEQAMVTTPATLLQLAVSQNADIDKLEKLMALQERWEAAEAKKAYVQAMTKFRAECPPIDKNKEGHNSKYATLPHTLALIKDDLSDNGLSHSWKTGQGENGLIEVTCCVTHNLGHQECTSMVANPDGSGSKNAIQAIGSAVTYLQRYTLFAILGLAAGDQDDDGKASSQGEPLDENQTANLLALMDEVNANKQAFLKHFKIETIEALQQSQLKGAIAMLEAKRKAK